MNLLHSKWKWPPQMSRGALEPATEGRVKTDR
jgi:hypothetical protein